MKVPRPAKLLFVGGGSALLLMLVVGIARYLLAPHFYLTRVIFWGEYDYKRRASVGSIIVHALMISALVYISVGVGFFAMSLDSAARISMDDCHFASFIIPKRCA